jgi:exosortase
MVTLKAIKNNYLTYIPLLLIICLYFPQFRLHYMSNWANLDYHHAYFILPVSLWLSWRQCRLNKIIIKPSSFYETITGLILLTFGALVFVHGWRNGYALLSTFSLIPVLAGYISFMFGFKVLRLFWFPLLYLILLIPPSTGILDSITLPMRFFITNISQSFLSFLGYQVVREGLIISVNNNEIYMGAPCSGFRSLITLLSLGSVYAYISSGNIKTKISLLFSIIPIALLGNFFRVISVCLAVNHFGSNLGNKVHDIGGYVVFIILIVGLIFLENFCLKLEKKHGKS